MVPILSDVPGFRPSELTLSISYRGSILRSRQRARAIFWGCSWIAGSDSGNGFINRRYPIPELDIYALSLVSLLDVRNTENYG